MPIVNDIDAYYRLGGTEAPYLLYVYPPHVEFEVRRDLGDLRLWLEARDIRCMAISLADLMWEALDEWGMESLFEAERAAQGNPAELERVYESVGEILNQPPTLPDRVLAALEDADDHTAAFLYRAGSLYPAYRTSTLLDDLRSRLNIPVTLLYPGRLVGSYGLRFMDRCDPTYGYRATIYARGGDA
jgi:hypothetical protein